MQLLGRWHQYWFKPVSVRRLAVVRIVTVSVVLFDLLVDPNGTRNLASIGNTFWNPDALVIVRELHLPRTPEEVSTVLWVILCVCSVLALVGLFTRFAFVMLAAGYAWWVMTSLSYSNVGHAGLISTVALFALAIAPAGAAYSLDSAIARARRATPGASLPEAADTKNPLAGWAVRFIGVVLVLAYTSAAYSKIRSSGLDWAFDGAMDSAVVEQGTWIGDILLEQPTLIHLMALSALVWEATAFLALVGGRARDAWVIFGVSFHLGSLLLLEVNFVDYPAAYVVFYSVEQVTERAGAVIRSWSTRRFDTIEVVYDGMCGVCVRAVSFLKSLDVLGLLRPVDGTAPGGARLQVFEARHGAVKYEGFAAYRRIARSVPLLLPLAPLLYVPPIPYFGNRIYEKVARNRGLSCSISATCEAPPVLVGGAARDEDGQTSAG